MLGNLKKIQIQIIGIFLKHMECFSTFNLLITRKLLIFEFNI